MQFTHEVTLCADVPWREVWVEWNDVRALPRLLSHIRTVASGESDDQARFVILLDGRHLEFAVERTMCADCTLCWQSLGETFLYVLSLGLSPAKSGDTVFTLTIAYDPPGFLPDVAEALGHSRRFKQTLEDDLHDYVQNLQRNCLAELVTAD